MRIGVDTGGTFTDCVTFRNGCLEILKVFSTPDDAARAIVGGVRGLAGPSAASEPLEIIHGTTVGTNSVLERRGARVALVTTAGFEDLIEIGRQARPRLYDLNVQRDPPLVPQALRYGVRERIASDGATLLKLRGSEIRRIAERVRRAGAESVAVCFLFSFLSPAHERAVAQALRGVGLPVSVSHEILPEFREYERLSTVVVNAFLAPRLGAYLARLELQAAAGLDTSAQLAEKASQPLSRPKSRGRIFVMLSSGGITTAARASRQPVRTILSGPAGGVVAARRLAERLRIQRAVSFDMGGTSTDVCLLDGAPRTTREASLAGLPIAVPVLDVHSVGAGGGSLARIDAGGALRVGPESAGAAPGPIAYGRGGTQPTVTDANLLLGRLDADFFLGGSFRLDARAVEEGFGDFLRRKAATKPRRRHLAFQTPVELARGIVSVSNATMERALRVISVERGHDPRDFAMISFGGAGGLHAADLARSLQISSVIIPQKPGAFSALGILLSDIVHDASTSVLLPAPSTQPANGAGECKKFLQAIARRFWALERAARAELRKEQFPVAQARAERKLQVRYVGQSYELSVPFVPRFREIFHREHEKAYGYAQPARPLEIVSLQLRLVIPAPQPPRAGLRGRVRASSRTSIAPLKRKPVWFFDRFWETPFYERERLRPGTRLRGPAVLVEYSSTAVVPPDFNCRVDPALNLVISHAR